MKNLARTIMNHCIRSLSLWLIILGHWPMISLSYKGRLRNWKGKLESLRRSHRKRKQALGLLISSCLWMRSPVTSVSRSMAHNSSPKSNPLQYATLYKTQPTNFSAFAAAATSSSPACPPTSSSNISTHVNPNHPSYAVSFSTPKISHKPVNRCQITRKLVIYHHCSKSQI